MLLIMNRKNAQNSFTLVGCIISVKNTVIVKALLLQLWHLYRINVSLMRDLYFSLLSYSIDISKAFNTVNYKALVSKPSSYEFDSSFYVTGKLLRIIYRYYSISV